MTPVSLYGLKIIPLDGGPTTLEWVSSKEGKVEEKAERLARYSGFDFIWGVETSSVIAYEFGWYATSDPKTLIHIKYRDALIVKGTMYALSSKGYLIRLDKPHRWYLNGQPVAKETHVSLLRKVQYEDHRGAIRNPY